MQHMQNTKPEAWHISVIPSFWLAVRTPSTLSCRERQQASILLSLFVHSTISLSSNIHTHTHTHIYIYTYIHIYIYIYIFHCQHVYKMRHHQMMTMRLGFSGNSQLQIYDPVDRKQIAASGQRNIFPVLLWWGWTRGIALGVWFRPFQEAEWF